MYACAETIYHALFAGVLGPIAGTLRTGRRGGNDSVVESPPRTRSPTWKLLDQHPVDAAERTTIGHLEGDLIIGRNMHSAIGTLVERVSRCVVLLHLPDGYTAPLMRDALSTRLLELPAALRETLTWDQGRELTLHEQIEATSGTKIFFCDPRSPWQRPTNENTNGLLRQYFPKRTNLAVRSRADLDRVAAELNARPRRVLNDRTPHEVLTDFLATNQTP
jgi:IS30 family transposase